MTFTKSKLTVLSTVYPPISNADAARLAIIPQVEEILRTSAFYMIVGRAQARLSPPDFDPEIGEMRFDFIVGHGAPCPVLIRLHELPGVAASAGARIKIEIDQAGTGFRVWDSAADQTNDEPLEWFTTEKLLWDKARGRSGIHGLERLRELATYDLLYVGIATKTDSFDRLIARGHKARQEILASEPQRYPGAKPSDETFLVMFAVEPTIMTTFDPDHAFSDADLSGEYDAKRIVADAEKAFVSLLQPPYNRERFANYPKGKDGLYGQGYDRYAYVIGEEMAFNTAQGTVRGGVNAFGVPTGAADMIFVEGDTVSFHSAGSDQSDEES